jgi:hypothetical protein
MAGKSIYPSIPAPGNDLPSMRATLDAMRQSLTMITMNAQDPNPNFTPSSASQVFVTNAQLKATGLVGQTGPAGPQGPPGPGIAEAPNDVNTYGRHGLAWTPVLPVDGSQPMTGELYFQVAVNAYGGIVARTAPTGGQGWGLVLGNTGVSASQQAGIINPAGQLVLWIDSSNVVHVMNPIVVGP